MAVVTLGVPMAMLDVSIVKSPVSTIQGEIRAAGTEGTWISTACLAAEIVIIPLSGWVTRLLGLRTPLLTAAILFVGRRLRASGISKRRRLKSRRPPSHHR